MFVIPKTLVDGHLGSSASIVLVDIHKNFDDTAKLHQLYKIISSGHFNKQIYINCNVVKEKIDLTFRDRITS